MSDFYIKALIYFKNLSFCGQQNIEDREIRSEKMSSKRRISHIDRIIEMLPEIHIIGYNYCGPNTNLERRLACGEPCINELDCACMEHDIAYAESNELKWRHMADKLLVLKAFRRVYAKDSRIGERFAALLVSWLISVKLFLGKMELYINSVRTCLAMKSRAKKHIKITDSHY